MFRLSFRIPRNPIDLANCNETGQLTGLQIAGWVGSSAAGERRAARGRLIMPIVGSKVGKRFMVVSRDEFVV
jgi:hypothetical protein